MKANETPPPLLPEWASEELLVTEAVIARYKVKKKTKLHCKQCLKVLAIGDMAMKATVLSKAAVPARAPKAVSREKHYFFCGGSCMRLFRLDMAERSALSSSYEPLEGATLQDINFALT